MTPTNVARRFTTQMYLYFLPLSNSSSSTAAIAAPTDSEAMIENPTADGGLEHTTARFLPAYKWLDLLHSEEIILFPPQLLLLHLIAPFLSPESATTNNSPAALKDQRDRLIAFVHSGNPPWTDKCISPTVLPRRNIDGRAVLDLSYPGPELEGRGREGEQELVVLSVFRKEGPRRVDVAFRKDVVEGEKSQEKL